MDSDPLSLNDGSIVAAADNNILASLTLPGIASAASLAGGSDVIVDTITPKFASATATGPRNDFVEIAFSEPVDGMPIADHFTVSNNRVFGVTILGTKIVGLTLGISVTDSQTVSYHGNSIVDAAGNPAEQFTDRLITNNLSDTDGPSPFITSTTVTNGGTTNSRMLSYSVQFFEAVTGFTERGIELSGTANPSISEFTEVNVTRYTFTVTANMDGTVIVSIPADTVEDLSENLNTASNTHTVTIDNVRPQYLSAKTTDATTITITVTETPYRNCRHCRLYRIRQ